MAIISSYDVDDSAALAKRFAALAASYVDDPVAAKSETAKVPLENIFRILEMFRYDAYADEFRRGVLMLEGPGRRPKGQVGSSHWHTAIARALDKALASTFASVTKDEAIEALENDLRNLASSGSLPVDHAQRVKTFFSTFEATLA
jgi:hypothetical protein